MSNIDGSLAQVVGFRNNGTEGRQSKKTGSERVGDGARLMSILGLILLSITAGHYFVSSEHHVIHNILQRLYYIPIVLAAYQRGSRGGAIVSVVSAILYLPHVIYGWETRPEYQVNQLIEVILFVAIGVSSGILFEQKVASQRTIRSHEKMAMFGNLSRSIIRSLKKPIRAIRGMLMALEPMSYQNPALASCLEIIVSEVEAIENMRNDLISLVERKRLRLKQQNLNDIMFQFMSQIEHGLSLKGIKIRRFSKEMELPAFLHRSALMQALHLLIDNMADRSAAGGTAALYTGQSYSYTWLGGSVGDIHLDGKDDSVATIVNSQCYGEYDLIPIVNVMNNHFGDVRFRWVDDKLVEFMLLFPKKLKLPWHLRDEPSKNRVEKDTREQTQSPSHSQ